MISTKEHVVGVDGTTTCEELEHSIRDVAGRLVLGSIPPVCVPALVLDPERPWGAVDMISITSSNKAGRPAF